MNTKQLTYPTIQEQQQYWIDKEAQSNNATPETGDDYSKNDTSETILRGNRCVIIDTFHEGLVTARLYVNARSNLAFNGTATQITWKGKTIHGARIWAQKQLQ